MSTKTYDKLRAELGEAVREAKAFTDKVAGRELTAEEKAQAEDLADRTAELRVKMKQHRADNDFTGQMAGIDDPDAPPLTEKTAKARMGSPAEGGAGSAWAKAAAGAMMATAKASGVKALTTGSIDVPSVVQTEVVTRPQLPRLIDLIVDRARLDGNTFEYLRQTARTNNAAPVADGALKPTSVFTVTPIEDRARVIAHLSEPFPERYLADYANLVRFLDDEMRQGVLNALEAQVVSGSGSGENMTGILNTSGITVVPWSTNIFTTIRKARTQMQVLGEQPTAWVMHPADLETVDLTTDADGRYYLTGGGGDKDVDALFGGLPRIPATSVPAGTAILADWRMARLYVREELRLDADRSGENFTKNLVTLRAEGRFGFAVLRPQAFAEVELTAPEG